MIGVKVVHFLVCKLEIFGVRCRFHVVISFSITWLMNSCFKNIAQEEEYVPSENVTFTANTHLVTIRREWVLHYWFAFSFKISAVLWTFFFNVRRILCMFGKLFSSSTWEPWNLPHLGGREEDINFKIPILRHSAYIFRWSFEYSKLIQWIEQRSILPHNMFSFRQNTGAIDCVEILVADIYLAFIKK